MDVNTIKLEDDKKYIIIDFIEKENNKYLVLVNENDEMDNEEELEDIMIMLNKKYEGEDINE